jgi:hypothetical protein
VFVHILRYLVYILNPQDQTFFSEGLVLQVKLCLQQLFIGIFLGRIKKAHTTLGEGGHQVEWGKGIGILYYNIFTLLGLTLLLGHPNGFLNYETKGL